VSDQLTGKLDALDGFSNALPFSGIDWLLVPDTPGVYVIYDRGEVLYVGMAGRDRGGSLRRRLKDHATGQVVNMFAQYLFLARVQFTTADRIAHPRDAKVACRAYILERCLLRYRSFSSAAEARLVEANLKRELSPALNAG
jgi:hypothetical protein